MIHSARHYIKYQFALWTAADLKKIFFAKKNMGFSVQLSTLLPQIHTNNIHILWNHYDILLEHV